MAYLNQDADLRFSRKGATQNSGKSPVELEEERLRALHKKLEVETMKIQAVQRSGVSRKPGDTVRNADKLSKLQAKQAAFSKQADQKKDENEQEEARLKNGRSSTQLTEKEKRKLKVLREQRRILDTAMKDVEEKNLEAQRKQAAVQLQAAARGMSARKQVAKRRQEVEKGGRETKALREAVFDEEVEAAIKVVKGPAFSKINGKDQRGCTALHIAAEADSLEKVCAAILGHAQFSEHAAQDNFGFTALHRAARADQLGSCKVLCTDKKYRCQAFGLKSHSGYTPLHSAAMHGHDEVVKYLLSIPVDPASRDEFGRTCLHIAAEHNHLDACLAMLAHENFPAELVGARNHWGLQACDLGDESIRRLLSDGKDASFNASIPTRPKRPRKPQKLALRTNLVIHSDSGSDASVDLDKLMDEVDRDGPPPSGIPTQNRGKVGFAKHAPGGLERAATKAVAAGGPRPSPSAAAKQAVAPGARASVRTAGTARRQPAGRQDAARAPGPAAAGQGKQAAQHASARGTAAARPAAPGLARSTASPGRATKASDPASPPGGTGARVSAGGGRMTVAAPERKAPNVRRAQTTAAR